MDLKGLNYYLVNDTITRYSGRKEIRWSATAKNDILHTFISLDGAKRIQILESEINQFTVTPLDNKICKVLYGKNS